MKYCHLLAVSAGVEKNKKKKNWLVFGLTNEVGDAAALTSGFLSFPRATKRSSLLRNDPTNVFKPPHQVDPGFRCPKALQSKLELEKLILGLQRT